ncbi:conserved hypothetical protein [Agrobacterium fabacearum S56]|uniref:hypothetical protein n=1 Tax=Agrobacterium tumefaciens TaxID=358 RepID=UPI0009BA31D7|nr:hypothetical protein [Agrobacterium tumefaciens]CUW97430.1 conserved hypothetical protein [Agrobacterium fabacearum S56]
MRGFLPGSIWHADDPETVQIREVYARYGLAMYKAQVLEHGIVNAVIIANVLPTISEYTDRLAWEEDFDRAFVRELAKTFGNMLRALEPLRLPDGIMVRLREAKLKRDRLAHHFFREHDENFLQQGGRITMITECEATIEFFSAVDADLEAFMRPLRERYGITDEWAEEKVASALAAGEPDSGSAGP